MAKVISQGDLVKSKAGRDDGQIFLVVKVDGKYAYIVNGKARKVQSLKKKNVKHLEKFSNASIIELAEKIDRGLSVGNKRVYLAIRTEKEKIQED